MKAIRPLLLALALALTFAVPAFAQGGTQQGSTQQSGMVTKTFKLTIYGTPPADQAFGLGYATAEQLAAADPSHPDLPVIFWCAPGAVPSGTAKVSDEPCKGNGTVYSTTLRFPRGTKLLFRYFAVKPSNPDGTLSVFFKSYDGEFPNGPEDYEVLSADGANSAWYSFGQTNQQTPSRMPATGAGGAREGSASPALLAPLVSLAACSALALKRAVRFQPQE